MLRKVKLYGELAKIVGHKELEAKVDNISQSIRFLTSNFPKTERYIANTNFKVLVGDYQISEKELEDPIGKQDLHFVPVITGAGGEGGLGRVLTGAAMSIHDELVQQGIDGESDEYYNQINKRMKEYFPQKFAESSTEEKTKAAPVQNVASVSRRSGGRKSVKLTKSQVVIAKKLGVPLEEYAKYVKEGV